MRDDYLKEEISFVFGIKYMYLPNKYILKTPWCFSSLEIKSGIFFSIKLPFFYFPPSFLPQLGSCFWKLKNCAVATIVNDIWTSWTKLRDKWWFSFCVGVNDILIFYIRNWKNILFQINFEVSYKFDVLLHDNLESNITHWKILIKFMIWLFHSKLN